MKTDLFDYELPQKLIAQTPAQKRSQSRLMVYDRVADKVFHRTFKDIVEYFQPGDLLVVNSSKVLPARIFTLDKNYELLFTRRVDSDFFEAMVRPGRKFKIGAEHRLLGGCKVRVAKINEDGLRVLKVIDKVDILDVLREYGEMPLPPYISSRESSPERYQTVYSTVEGSIAAPTAGLHFEEEVFEALRLKGVRIAEIILHVGLGTFKPVEADDLRQHKMHEEYYNIPAETVELFSQTRKNNKKVWACGTTTVRALESSVDSNGNLLEGSRSTNCFIMPGYEFRATDRMITNFHLPKSTLIVLVAAFCSRETVLKLYKHAVENAYRFYSFGDSMVIL